MMGRRTQNDRGRSNPYDCSVELHGMYSQEAMELVAKTIATHPHCSILVIHGDGTGVLRNAVRGALKAHRFPAVRDYFFGEDIGAPGLDGTTVVYT